MRRKTPVQTEDSAKLLVSERNDPRIHVKKPEPVEASLGVTSAVNWLVLLHFVKAKKEAKDNSFSVMS